MSFLNFVVVLFLVWAGYRTFTEREISRPAGILIPQEPLQSKPEANLQPFKYKNALIEPLAEYDISARILSIEKYRTDQWSVISPVDWAVGWGIMSDTSVLEQLNVSQGDRFYFLAWRQNLTANTNELQSHSANMHLIPANDEINAKINKAHRGSLVTLRGYLVRANLAGTGVLESSLVRNDSGAGACEVMYVTDISLR